MKPGIPLDALNWFIMFIFMSVVWYIMRDISRRLGEALHIRKYYRLYDLCEAVLVVCIVLLFAHFVLGLDIFAKEIEWLPKVIKVVFLACVVVEVAVTINYWGWIVAEVLAPKKK